MMKVLFVLGFLLSMNASATSLELKKNSGSIFIEEKTGWKLSKDLFGMPFIYFSPESNGQRSNISFTDTGADLELDVKSLTSSQTKYQDVKKAWAQQVGATTKTFIPFKSTANKYGHKVHSIGFTYGFEGKNYQEASYYIECRGKLIFAKSLRLIENAKHDQDFSDLINSLDCGGV